jgi:hypothetical protein
MSRKSKAKKAGSLRLANHLENSRVDGMHAESWDQVSSKLDRLAHPKHSIKMYGDAFPAEYVYLWGVAAATGGACSQLVASLARLTLAKPLSDATSDPDSDGVDFDREAARFMDSIETCRSFNAEVSHLAVLWAAALPALASRMEAHRWWRLVAVLRSLSESVVQRSSAYSVDHLMLAGELGLTLAWRVPCVDACASLSVASAESVRSWCDRDQEAVSVALSEPESVRLVLASLMRCELLMQKVAKRKFRKSDVKIKILLARWAAVLTNPIGTAFSAAAADVMDVDLEERGMIDALRRAHPDSLEACFEAACGGRPTGGRLAWEVGLPETWHHDRDARLAIGFAQWDVRQGRFHLDYGAENPRFELFAGRRKVFAGEIQVRLEVDGAEQRPSGEWTEICQYSDDDVHYLEIEQNWGERFLLQRQVMLVRDDRSLLIADSVIPEIPEEQLESRGKDGAEPVIDYWCNFPLASSMNWVPEPETREGYLADNRKRVLLVPLAASEWSMGPTESTLGVTADRHLQLTARGRSALYAPLWFDFQKRRFTRPRTWRQLTVGDQLRLVNRHEATAYRFQAGSEQWMVYRSLGERRCRTALGKHLIAEFYASRFHPGDGTHEELVTVEDKCSADDD